MADAREGWSSRTRGVTHLGLDEEPALYARHDCTVELRNVRGGGELVLVLGELDTTVSIKRSTQQRRRTFLMALRETPWRVGASEVLIGPGKLLPRVVRPKCPIWPSKILFFSPSRPQKSYIGQGWSRVWPKIGVFAIFRYFFSLGHPYTSIHAASYLLLLFPSLKVTFFTSLTTGPGLVSVVHFNAACEVSLSGAVHSGILKLGQAGGIQVG